MWKRYGHCTCSSKCEFKFKSESCFSSDIHRTALGHIPYCINHGNCEKAVKNGISETIKELIKKIIEEDTDSIPKFILMKLINNEISENLIPSLRQVIIIILDIYIQTKVIITN